MSDETMDLETADGESIEGNVYYFKGDSDAMHEHLAMTGRIAGSMFGQASAQRGYNSGSVMGRYDRERMTLEPPVPLEYYVSLYRNDPIQRAAVEAKVHNIAMQGYRIRPRREAAMIDSGAVTPGPHADDVDPDTEERERVEEFLELGLPDYPFTEILGAMWRDVEVMGNGYIEFSRDQDGNLDGIYPIKGVSIRHLRDEKGYIHSRSGGVKYFSKYAVNPRRRFEEVLVKAEKESQAAGRGKNKELVYVPQAWGTEFDPIDSDVEKMNMFVGMAENDEATQPVNELLAWKKDTPLDTVYGEPDIVSAIYDILGSESVSLFNLGYFEKATVPRMAIFVRGGEMSSDVRDKIQDWVRDQSSLDVLNQVLLVEYPDPNVDIRVERLGVGQLQEAGFGEYQARCDERICVVNRTPTSMVYLLSEVAREGGTEANMQWLSSVVRPEQRRIESRLNYIIKNDLGVTDWVLDLNTPELISEVERANFFETLIGRGVFSVNDVRRFYGLAPTKGGDEPFIQAAGQGAIPIRFIDDVVQSNLLGGGGEDEDNSVVSGELKTPSNETPLAELPEDVREAVGQAMYAKINRGALDNLSEQERREMELILEDLNISLDGSGGGDNDYPSATNPNVT